VWKCLVVLFETVSVATVFHEKVVQSVGGKKKLSKVNRMEERKGCLFESKQDNSSENSEAFNFA
jgi:hypothetical protein